jgi:SOS-response transcriptional repressor LexA
MTTTFIGEKINKYLKDKNFTQTKLANKTGFSRNFINMILKGNRTASLETIRKIAEVLEINYLSLIEGDNIAPADMPTRKIPIISYVQAGTWHEPYEINKEDIDEWVGFDTNDPNAFGLRVIGKSMEPNFNEGDRIIISPRMEPQSGDYVIVKYDGNVTFKKLKLYKEMLILQPLNPDFEEIFLSGEQLKNFKEIGKVIGQIKRF